MTVEFPTSVVAGNLAQQPTAECFPSTRPKHDGGEERKRGWSRRRKSEKNKLSKAYAYISKMEERRNVQEKRSEAWKEKEE